MFEDILAEEDMIERAKYIEDVRKKCKQLGRLTEFNNLLRVWVQRNAQLSKQERSNTTQFTDAQLTLNCGKWIANDTGVVLADVNKAGEVVRTVACPHPILPVERYVNIDTETEKVKLSFFKDNRWREIIVPCGTISNKSYISNLSDRGVMVTSETASSLVKYINECIALNMNEIPLNRSISRLGWLDEGFAPYQDAVKYDGDLDFKSLYEKVTEKGDYKVWLEHIKELRQDMNIRLMLDTSLGSVLLEKVGALPFVFHLWGTTGFGKTVSLMIASSVWGDPEMGALTRSMNMTANAMSRTLAFLYSIPFCADELQQIKDRWNNYDAMIMYVTEGIDRGKAKAHGGIEEVQKWKNAIILTGEEPVTKSSSGGGAKNRCIEVEVKNKVIKDGNYTANLVKANYGFAGKQFVEHISAKTEEEMRKEYKKLVTEVLAKAETTDKQAMSVAVILLADKYACECIFDDEPLKADDVKDLLSSSKSIDVSERAYEWVLDWLAQNYRHFDLANDNTDCWGFIDSINTNIAVINKTVLVKAMSEEGYEFDACKRKWADSGKLVKNSDGKYMHQTKVKNIKSNYIKLDISAENNCKVDFEELPFG